MSVIEKARLGNTGLSVSKIGFGVLTVGQTQLNLSVNSGADLLRYAIDGGITFLDTAQYYQTYPYIREALKGYQGQDIVICSKSLHGSYDSMRSAVEEARMDLNRDVIEIFLLHEVRHDGDWERRSGAWEYLNEAKAKGLVKAIGISTHHVDVAESAAVTKEVDVLFPLINFRGLGIRHGSGPGEKEDMARAILAASDAGKGVFAMKVFGGGNLTGDYQEALRYVSSLPGIASMMIGFGYHHEIDQILSFIDGSMDTSFQPSLGHKRMRIDAGDCEGCGACILRCPNGAITKDHSGSAVINQSVCLNCGYCAPHCPVRAIIML